MSLARTTRQGAVAARAVWLFVTGLLVVPGATACDEVGPLPRCEAVADYLDLCAPECPRPGCGADETGDDVLNLDSADASDLAGLDACLPCLQGEAEAGRCTDCVVEGREESCLGLLGRVTGLACLAP